MRPVPALTENSLLFADDGFGGGQSCGVSGEKWWIYDGFRNANQLFS
jgi:hypothetical protein